MKESDYDRKREIVCVRERVCERERELDREVLIESVRDN